MICDFMPLISQTVHDYLDNCLRRFSAVVLEPFLYDCDYPFNEEVDIILPFVR